MFQKCVMHAAAEVMPQLQNSHATVGAAITQGNESATFPFFDHHLGYDRYSIPGRHHRQNSGEVAALEDELEKEDPQAPRNAIPDWPALLESPHYGRSLPRS
jgi:hypothetical protein